MANAYDPEFSSGAGAGRAREPERTPASERSPVDLIKDIVGNIQEIIRSEFRLARVEMREKAAAAARAGMMLAAGAVVGLYAAGFLLVCAYNLLSLVLPAWASALIVAVVLGGAAMGMIAAGRKRLKTVTPTPERTVATVKEDVEWLRNQTK